MTKDDETTKKKKRTVFRGFLTDEIREDIDEIRKKYQYTYQNLADIFGVTWTTIWRWLSGRTRKCQRAYRSRMEAFLNEEILIQLDENSYEDTKEEQKTGNGEEKKSIFRRGGRLPGSILKIIEVMTEIIRLLLICLAESCLEGESILL